MTPADGDFLQAVRRLHRAKDAAYRDAWKRRGEVISSLANIARKVDRLEYGLGGAPAMRDESWLDTAVDLFVYCLKYQTYLADLDAGVAGSLFSSSEVRSAYSTGPAAFEALLARTDLAPLDAPGPGTAKTAAQVFGRFGELEACFHGVSSTRPAADRLFRVQALTGATCGLSARSNTTTVTCTPTTSRHARRTALMRDDDYAKLLADLEHELLSGAGPAGVLGLTSVTLRLLASLAPNGLRAAVDAVYALGIHDAPVELTVPVRPLQALSGAQHGVLVVAADEEKQDLLCAALPFIQGAPKVIVAGYGHLAFRDRLFLEELAQLLVPSLANGYPNSLVHLYQCLANAARLGLCGVVAEFGMFKGGTTMFLARVIERLGAGWPVIGFDTFGGFPPRRSPLDMYDHPDCVFTDQAAVRRYLDGHNVEIVAGDIAQTCKRLEDEDLVLSFIDTDNYTPAKAALEIVRERTVPGGAIVFDHFTGTSRFRYAIGERIAGRVLLDDPRYLHLHGTGVFYRQPEAASR